ncbi:MAG TPA: YqiA/YcfP family alpha/beta fold hydrolase [Wenzhouxiangella sp.]|nr:YqiA/YcfP family alpha/beta fold hydrolase [Wenzhouxiangella sp.]
MTTTVIFSHGHLSSPQSSKIQALAPMAEKAGFKTLAIDYRDLKDDPVGRAERLVKTIGELPSAPVLVGSSMGGWVSMTAAEKLPASGLFLMAPALFLENTKYGGSVPDNYRPKCNHVSIIHGWNDDIIPWQNSLKHASASRAALHLVDSDHRLEGALADIKNIFSRFIQQVIQQASA